MIDKDSLQLDRPRRTPDHPTKSHVVKTMVDGSEKIIRFGEQGASTAGKPKEGESDAMKAKRASFKARHGANIAKGKSSPAYWADKVKWAKGGSVSLEELDQKYEGIKKPDFENLRALNSLIQTLQQSAEESRRSEFDPVAATRRSAPSTRSLADLFTSYEDAPMASHAGRAEAGVKPADALSLAASQMGLSETGQRAAIQDYLTTGGANLDPATTAWCAAFVNSTLQQTGGQGTGSNMARSFLDWGQPVDQPQEGDVAVFSRGDPSGPYGHVGFFKGYDDQGNVLVLGGNQGDAVSISPYPRENLLGFRRAGEAEPQKFAKGGLKLHASERRGLKQKDISGDVTFRGDIGSLTPSFSYSQTRDSQNYPDGIVVDTAGQRLGFALNGELLLDKEGLNRLRAGISRDTQSASQAISRLGELLDKGSYKDGITKFNLGADLGQLSLDMVTDKNNTSGKAVYRLGENAEISAQGSKGSEPKFGFNFSKNFSEGGLAELTQKYDRGGEVPAPKRGEVMYAVPPPAESWGKGSSPKRERKFGELALEMADPYIAEAYDALTRAPVIDANSYIPQSVQRINQAIGNTGSAALNAMTGLVYGGAGLAGDVADATGLGDGSRLARDLAAMADVAGVTPEGRMLSVLLDAGAARDVGRKIVERANQRGPVPVMGSNFGNVLGDVGEASTGIRAYHNSPHDFNRFSMSQIGTGEGAQAYGHGLYFAESPSVSGRGGDYWKQFFNKMPSGPERTATGAMYANKFDAEKAASQLEANVRYHADRAKPGKYADGPEIEEGNRLLAEENQQALDMIRSGQIVGPRTYEVNINADPNKFLDWDKPLSEQPEVANLLGYSDAARIAADRKKLYGQFSAPKSLEYDDLFGPLSAQEKAAAEQLSAMPEPWNEMTGKDAWFRASKRKYAIEGPSGRFGPGGNTYEEALQLAGGDPNKVRTISDPSAPARAEFMREAGIPGIRYLDASSRSLTAPTIKESPSGVELYWGNDPRPVDTFPTRQAAEEAAKQLDTRSRNLVVFDDKLISIVKKYGIAGAAAMLGVSAGDVEAAMAEGQQQSQGGNVAQYDPEHINMLAESVRKPGFAKGGHVQYDPAAIDSIINQLREVNHG